MNNDNSSKINRIGKILYIATKIANVLFIIVAILGILLTAVFAIAPENTVKIDFTSIANVSFNKSGSDPVMYNQALSSTLDAKPLAFACGIVSVMVINTLILLIFAKKLFGAVRKCESPLEKDVITSFRKFSAYLIPWYGFDIILSALLKSVFTKKFDLSLNPGTLVIIIVALVISYAFKSDNTEETLI